MELLETMLSEVDRGKAIIESCINACDERQSNNKIVLLFPDDDLETLQSAYKYIDIVMNSYDVVIVISSINIDDMHIYSRKNKKIIVTYIDEDDMRCLLRYRSVVSIASIKIISLTMPYNQKAKSLVGFKDLSFDKIVCRSLYGIFGNISV